MKRLLLIPVAVTVLVGCVRDPLLGPHDPALSADRAGSPALNVVTYNVYYGAPIEELLLVPPEQIPFKAAELWGAVQATNFAERAAAIAAGIETANAHVVGLQEMALFRSESPSDFVPGQPLPPADATHIELDYVDILMQALAARGLSYDVAAVTLTFDIEVPMVNLMTGGLDDTRLTEMLVVLVRSDVESTNAAGGTFLAALPIEIGGQTIYKPSGWASVDITFKGLPYRFLDTHLEPADMGGVLVPELVVLQAYQAAELLAIADRSDRPVIMVGDFNSDADGGTTPTYGDVLDAGFLDTWLIGPPRGAVAAEQLGEEQGDRTPSGLWPSDHAGVAAALRIAPGKGYPR